MKRMRFRMVLKAVACYLEQVVTFGVGLWMKMWLPLGQMTNGQGLQNPD